MIKQGFISIKDVLKKSEDLFLLEEKEEFLELEVDELQETNLEANKNIPVVFDDNVEAIEVHEIRDKHGRLSDAIDAVMEELGLSILPFDMLDIADTVIELKRHEIFSLHNRKYAVSQTVRNNVIKSYKDMVIETLSAGLSFKDSLYTKVSYQGNDYKTLSLSPHEYEHILSAFRYYKELLYITESDLVLEIFNERNKDVEQL